MRLTITVPVTVNGGEGCKLSSRIDFHPGVSEPTAERIAELAKRLQEGLKATAAPSGVELVFGDHTSTWCSCDEGDEEAAEGEDASLDGD